MDNVLQGLSLVEIFPKFTWNTVANTYFFFNFKTSGNHPLKPFNK